MQSKKLSIGLNAVLAVVLLITAKGAVSQTETILHSFGGTGTDGTSPASGLISDVSGDLYGTTLNGGVNHFGTVFALRAGTGGTFTERILHAFNNADGGNPYGGLILDAHGRLYGTTNDGGASFEGVVFELKPMSGGGYEETVLHSFAPDGVDGFLPIGGLVTDYAGRLYGTTNSGGTSNYGTVFELTPSSDGVWEENVLFSFDSTDGASPSAAVVIDHAHNLYSTTYLGGTNDNGTVFKLTRSSSGTWTETIPLNFDFANGVGPTGALIFDGAGNLYGTTVGGGASSGGTVFELTPAAGGVWTQTILHSFSGGADGFEPWGGLIFDASGNLYGTTYWGGLGGCRSGGAIVGCGTVFKLTPSSGGTWTETILHSFNNDGADGANPYFGTVALDTAGNVYGTTERGGAYGKGTVFEITP